MQSDTGGGIAQLGYGQEGTSSQLKFYYTLQTDGYPYLWPGAFTPIVGDLYSFTVGSSWQGAYLDATYKICNLSVSGHPCEAYIVTASGRSTYVNHASTAWWGVEAIGYASMLGVYPSGLYMDYMGYQWFNGGGLTGWRTGLTSNDIFWLNKLPNETDSISSSYWTNDCVDWKRSPRWD